jgi:hypothetical protein
MYKTRVEQTTCNNIGIEKDSLRSVMIAAMGRERGGEGAAEQAFRAEVFVNVGPVNAVASIRRCPVVSLLLRRVQKPRIQCVRPASFSLGVDIRIRV